MIQTAEAPGSRQSIGRVGFRNLRDCVRGRGREAVAQLVLVAVLYVAYCAGRVFASGQELRAFGNARSVRAFELALRFPSEARIQGFFAKSDTLAVVANTYYATVHFPFAIAVLLWLWIYRAEHYRWTRNVMVALTSTALVIHALFPLAPPRMLPDFGYIDLAAKYGQSVYGPPETDTLSNQFAAMPSLHVGWALLLSFALFMAFRSPWRWVFLVHPAITTGVVVVTGNHYWMDGIIAALILVLSMVLFSSSRPRRRESGSIRPDSDEMRSHRRSRS